MREIELKIKLLSDSYENLIQKWSGNYELTNEIIQVDTIYVHKKFIADFPALPQGTPVLRIRDDGVNTTLTLKKKFKNELDCVEEECIVSELNSITKLVEHLDFAEVVKVQKRRTNFQIDEYNCSLDSVDELGDFLEVEFLTESMDIDSGEIIENMKALIIEMDLGVHEEITKGYDSLLIGKKMRATLKSQRQP